jgi:hypothetical protein
MAPADVTMLWGGGKEYALEKGGNIKISLERFSLLLFVSPSISFFSYFRKTSDIPKQMNARIKF